jgi:ubiquinone/menaquinone biosynthesis C-methylase UbiE
MKMANTPTLLQWNDSAAWYDQNMGKEGDELNKVIIRPNVLQTLGNLQGKSFLDVGCGSGYLTSESAKMAVRVVGTDFAPSFIQLCQEKYKDQSNLSFQTQDITKKFDFQDEVFDVVLCKMVLQYVEDIGNFAHESVRVLKEGGRVIIVVDHPFHSQFYYAQQSAGKKNPKYGRLEDYFSKNSQTKLSLWGKVELTWYPKKVEDYLQPFIKVGMVLSYIREIGETKGEITIPRILLFEFKKP